MIITILCIVLFIVGIVLVEKRLDWLECVGVMISFLSGIGAFLCIIAVLCTQVSKETDYQNKLYEKEVLEYRIEKLDENITGNEMLYNDIVEFNNSLRITKKWANSPWTNWFHNADIATIDYIELGK